jgi:hypothetical protein
VMGGTGVTYIIWRVGLLMYIIVFRDGSYWCTVQYLEGGGTGDQYSI